MSNEFIVPTGRIIKEYLDEYNISQKELAARLGMSQKHISNLLNSKSRLTEEVAIRLESIFKDIPASYWLNLESKYREYIAREEEDEKLRNCDLDSIANKFKFKEVFSGLDWDIVKQAKEMLRILKISDFKNFKTAYSNVLVEFMEDGGDLEPIIVWLNLCEEEIEIQNGKLDDVKYSRKNLVESLLLFKKIALIETADAIIKNCKKICNKVGIYLVINEAITNSKIRGALTTYHDHPAIYLSGRFKTHDHIWFAFMHEIGHLLKHYEMKETIISYEPSIDIKSSEKEEEANEFARNFFIEPYAYRQFIQQHDFTEKGVRIFAANQKVLPGIVVARLQHDKYLEMSQLNQLKNRIIL